MWTPPADEEIQPTWQPPADEALDQQQPQQPDSSMGDVALQAAKEAVLAKGTSTRALATDPITQAKALPALAGTIGGMSPIPGGATLGTMGGRLLSDAALASYGRKEEIPSIAQHVAEGALSAAGDVMAIPYMKKSIYGKQIGKAEQAAKVPPPQDIKSLPRPVGVQGISNTIDDTIGMVKSPEVNKDPVFWKQLKDQVDFFYQRGRDEVLSKGDRAKLAWLSSTVQDGLNTTIQGRAEPAAAMAKAMTIPNKIKGAYQMLPRRARIGMEYFGGPAGAATLFAEYARRKMSQ